MQNQIVPSRHAKQQTPSGSSWESLQKALDTHSEAPVRGVSVVDARALLAMRSPDLCPPELALEYAEAMAARMPAGDQNSKEFWLRDAVVIFTRYAERDVFEMAMNPVSGIRATETFLPDPPKLLAFLNGLAARRGRILRNAKILVDEHDRQASEKVQTPEQREAMARKVMNLSRGLKGLCSVEMQERSRAQQAEFNAYCHHIGNGDLAEGYRIMNEKNMTEPPPNWRDLKGWQGEIA